VAAIKDILSGTWLGKVYLADKLLFGFVFLFFWLSLFSNLIRLQTSPFFIWSMYSMEIHQKEYYHFCEIRYNDNQLVNLRHSWNEPEKTFLTVPLDDYLSIRARDSQDPFEVYLRSHWLKKHPGFTNLIAPLYMTTTQLDQFPAWYKRWLTRLAGEPVSNIYVIDKKLQFKKDGGLIEIASDTVLFIP
jgi:hypothetical protein